jgi:hypothetical protein
LLAWLLPLTALAVLAIWMVYQDALQHFRKHGHVHLSPQLVLFAIWSTGSTVTILVIWLYTRKRARGKR